MNVRVQQRLVFGRDRDPGVVEEIVVEGGPRTKQGTLKSNPLIVVYGKGPAGAKCGDCVHFFRQGGVAGTYYKCELRRVTSGPATDHRVRWPACGKYEVRT